MKERGSIKIFLILIIIITIVSGVIAFKVADKRNVEDLKTLENNKEKEEETSIAIKDAKKKEVDKKNIYSVFDEVENIYIQNPNIPTNVVEIGDRDRSFIVANFKSISKHSSTLVELKKSIVDLNKYDYQISIPMKSTKINLYSSPSYIVFEEKNNIQWIYSANEEQIEDLIKVIENIYIDNTLSRMMRDLPSQIHIEARDDNSSYILRDKEIKELMEKLYIVSLEDNSKYINIPVAYPDYNINIKKDDKEYNLNLINEETMIVETPMVYLYCKYDRSLWQYVQEKLPIQISSKENELEYLLNAERVIVKDIDDIYDIQNSTYYNLIIPRWINKIKPQKIDKEIESIKGNDLKFSLEFLIKDQWKEVLIYKNYIVYSGDVYLSQNIAETIRSLLMVP